MGSCWKVECLGTQALGSRVKEETGLSGHDLAPGHPGAGHRYWLLQGDLSGDGDIAQEPCAEQGVPGSGASTGAVGQGLCRALGSWSVRGFTPLGLAAFLPREAAVHTPTAQCSLPVLGVTANTGKPVPR